METPVRILCLEDDQEDFETVERVLQKSGLNYLAERVDHRHEFLAALKSFSPDVVLSDHALPEFDSSEALKLTLENNADTPFILVTGAVSDEFAARCILLGAEDYLLKSNLNRLPNAIKNAIKRKEAAIEKKQAAQKIAEQNEHLLKINNELDSFVYSVSHNIRAPLMSVLGLLNLIRLEKNPEVVDDYHDKMETAIHKLDETLKEILDYSRNARQEVRIERVNLRALMEENMDKLRFLPDFKRLKTTIKLKEHTLFYTDAYRISMILNNLFSNAIKYQDTSKEQSRLSIDIVITAETAILQFMDNGIGIAAELLEKVGSMFFRATHKSVGSGLGLYIVRETIEKLQGKIEIKSTLGEGTSFRIELPNQLL